MARPDRKYTTLSLNTTITRYNTANRPSVFNTNKSATLSFLQNPLKEAFLRNMRSYKLYKAHQLRAPRPMPQIKDRLFKYPPQYFVLFKHPQRRYQFVGCDFPSKTMDHHVRWGHAQSLPDKFNIFIHAQ